MFFTGLLEQVVHREIRIEIALEPAQHLDGSPSRSACAVAVRRASMTADIPRSYPLRILRMCRAVIPSTYAGSAQLSCLAIALGKFFPPRHCPHLPLHSPLDTPSRGSTPGRGHL